MSLSAALSSLLESQERWEGTPTALWELTGIGPNPKQLSRAINDHKVRLAEVGIHCWTELRGTGNNRARLWVVSSRPAPRAGAFFWALFGGCAEQHHLVVWCKRGEQKTTYAFTGPEAPERAADTADQQDRLGADVYFGLGLQNEPPSPGGRGKESTVGAIPGVWIDLDVAGEGHKNLGLCPDFESALKILESFPLAPSIVNQSGGGLHGYWLFETPLLLWGSEQRAEAKSLVRRFQDWFRRPENNPNGWGVDSTNDLARVLRVPYTRNWKSDPPKEVRPVVWELDRKYSVSSIAEHLPEEAAPEAKTSPAAPVATARLSGNLNGYTREEVLARALEYAKSFDPATPGRRSHSAFRISALLRNDLGMDHFGLSGTALQILHDWNSRNPDPLPSEKVEQCYRDGLKYAKEPVGSKLLAYEPNGASTAAGVRNRPARNGKALDEPALDDSEVEDAETGIQLQLPSDAPRLVAPAGYQVREDGIWIKGVDEAGMSAWNRKWETPVIITELVRDSLTQKVSTVLFWPAAGRVALEPGVPADHRALAKMLNSFGYATTVDRCKGLAEFLRRFQLANAEALRFKDVSNHFGWWRRWPGEKPAFILGDHVEGGAANSVKFASQEGGQAIREALSTAGTQAEWMEAIKGLQGQPRALLAFYAAFAAPLLECIKAPSFVVDVCGETSRGKTTLLKCCASIYGDPDPSAGGLIQGWKSTQVAIERRSGILKNLPIILDDTRSLSAQERRSLVSAVIYMLAQGRGKERGSLAGIRKACDWRTVSLVSGEGRIIQMSTESGKNARTITLWGNPFRGEAHEQKSLVHRLNRACGRNYGWAGRKWVAYLRANHEAWKDWQAQWESIRNAYEAFADGNPQVERLAGYLACIELAGQLAHKAVELPFEYEPIPEHLVKQICSEIDESDAPREALRLAYDWACANPGRFYGRHTGLIADAPPSGWAGKWDLGDSWTYLGWFPPVLDKILTDGGYDAAEMRQRWGDRGWLDRDAGNLTKLHRVNGERGRLICIHRHVVDGEVLAPT